MIGVRLVLADGGIAGLPQVSAGTRPTVSRVPVASA